MLVGTALVVNVKDMTLNTLLSDVNDVEEFMRQDPEVVRKRARLEDSLRRYDRALSVLKEVK